MNQYLDLSLRLFSWAMLLNSIELIFIFQSASFQKVWSYQNLKNELTTGLPFPEKLIQFLFSEKSFRLIIIMQLLVSTIGLFFLSPIIVMILLVTQLLTSIRFRGTFNGGSDMMTFVVLTGLIIATISPKFQKIGLIYITIHTLYSYFKAGLVKALQPDWRQGKALAAFLKRSLYADIQSHSAKFSENKFLGKLLCWLVMIFEMGALVVLFVPRMGSTYFIFAIIFHFVISVSFGLNRFFWIWLSAWPAVLYTISLI